MPDSRFVWICEFDGCTRESLPGCRYCRWCQRKGSQRDYERQAALHREAVKARHERSTAAPEAWKILLGYCEPLRSGVTYTYAIGIHKYVKFGQAQSVEGRLMNLQIANPRRLHLLGTIRSSREMEHHLHAALRNDACRGEWFKLNDTTREIIRLMNQNDLVGICKRMSLLLDEKHGIALLQAFRNRMYIYEQGLVVT